MTKHPFTTLFRIYTLFFATSCTLSAMESPEDPAEDPRSLSFVAHCDKKHYHVCYGLSSSIITEPSGKVHLTVPDTMLTYDDVNDQSIRKFEDSGIHTVSPDGNILAILLAARELVEPSSAPGSYINNLRTRLTGTYHIRLWQAATKNFEMLPFAWKRTGSLPLFAKFTDNNTLQVGPVDGNGTSAHTLSITASSNSPSTEKN